MKIALIVAMGENRVIGVDNRMPWRLSADLKRFRQITWGKPILMGRRTHESIGKPLPGRKNIVLSTDAHYQAEGCTLVHSLEEALAAAQEAPELMVIGGAALYRECLPMANHLYLTLIHRAFTGDTYFPALDWTEWREVAREDIDEDAESGLEYSFVELERIHPTAGSRL
jgi:dihydrofolate reductase